MRRSWWNVERLLTIAIPFIVALGALAIAIKTEHHTLPRIETYIKEELRGALTTIYVQDFPQNIDAIVDLLRSAAENDTVLISCDVAAYGAFSNPKKYFEYRSELVRLANLRGGEGKRSSKLVIQVYDTAFTRRHTEEQFAVSVKSFSDFLSSDKYQRFIHQWEADQGGPGNWFRTNWKDEPANKEDFINRVMKLHIHELNTFEAAGAKVQQVDRRSNVFVWRRNRDEAVFSFYSYADGYFPEEVSIRTRDGVLLSSLLKQLPPLDIPDR